MDEDKKSKLLHPRWAILIDMIWIIIWSTTIYRMDGNYPGDYMTWFVIVAVAGLIAPWCFVDGEYLK
jgi:hypothetical protein